MQFGAIRQSLSTLSVNVSSKMLDQLRLKGDIMTRVDVDVPDPDNFSECLLVCKNHQQLMQKSQTKLPPVAIFVTGRPVSPLMPAKKIIYESDPKPHFEIERNNNGKIENEIINLATFLSDNLVQKPDEYFDKELSKLVHQHSVGRLRAFLNACQIHQSVYQIFDGGIAPYACLHPAAHSPEFLFNSDTTCASYVVTTPEEVASFTDRIREIKSVDERKVFLKQILTQASNEIMHMGTQQDYWELLTNQFPNVFISCLVGGPLTGLLNTHNEYPSLTNRVIEVKMMSMAHTGIQNLFGNNFNIMVDPEATKKMLKVFVELGIQVVCISSETCKTPVYTISGDQIRSLSVDQCLHTQSVAIQYVAAIIDQWTGVKGSVQPCYDATTVHTVHDLVRSVDVVPIKFEWVKNPKPQISQIPGLENTGLAITPIGPALTPESLYSPGVYITGTTFTDQARELFLDLFRNLN
jgi:hypothetical protein